MLAAKHVEGQHVSNDLNMLNMLAAKYVSPQANDPTPLASAGR